MAENKKGMTYSDKLKNPKWQRKRLEILKRDDFTCKYCGDKETELHVHHKSYRGNPWESNNKELQTICKHCHLIIHKLGDITQFKVIKHYDTIFDVWTILLFCKTGVVMFTYNKCVMNYKLCIHSDVLNIINQHHKDE